jgi:tetratricopeptide (TPR) repeat protein
MQEIDAPPLAPLGAARSRLDLILGIVAWFLALGLILFAAWFAYDVYQTRNAEDLSTPAMRAIHDLKLMVKRSPNDATLRVRLGEALATAGLSDEAAQQLGDAIKINPKHDGAYLDLGMIAGQQKNWAAAEGYFKKVVELTAVGDYQNVNGRRENAFFYLGQIMLEQNRYDDAVGYFKAALRIRRDSSDSYFNLALAFKGLKNYDAEIKQLEAALAFDSKYGQAAYEMGEAYLAKKDVVNGSYWIARAAKLSPNQDQPKEALAALGSADEWGARANAALAKGDLETAIDDVLIALNIKPNDVGLLKLQGQIAEKRGDKKTAIAAYKAAAKLAPKDNDLKAAVKRLGGK